MSKLFQFSSISSLADGNFDGKITYRDLMQHGNFGLGTFDALDGEMIAFNGNFYQLKSDGTALVVAPEATSPFASVLNFEQDMTMPLQELNAAGLIAMLEKLAAEKGN